MRIQPGIYALSWEEHRKIYVGSSTISAPGRITTHLRNLSRGSHSNPKLQSIFDKYGTPVTKILLWLPKELAENRVRLLEERAIERYTANGWDVANIVPPEFSTGLIGNKFGSTNKGRPKSEEHRGKIAEANRKRGSSVRNTETGEELPTLRALAERLGVPTGSIVAWLNIGEEYLGWRRK